MRFLDQLEPVEIDPKYISFLLLRKIVNWLGRLGLIIAILSLILGALMLFSLLTDSSYSFSKKLEVAQKPPVLSIPLQGLVIGFALYGFATIAWSYLNHLLSKLYEELSSKWDEKWLKNKNENK